MHTLSIDVLLVFLFFFNATATTKIYTLSLHDALPIFATAVFARSVNEAVNGALRSRCDLPARRNVTERAFRPAGTRAARDRKSTRLNSSHMSISYAVFCLKKKKKATLHTTLTSTLSN